MKKLFFPIMFLLAAGSMQAQTYNELVEKAMDYTLKDRSGAGRNDCSGKP